MSTIVDSINSLTAAAQGLTNTVNNKIEDIDNRVDQARAEFDGFIASHLTPADNDGLHPRFISPNVLRNSALTMVNGTLPAWAVSNLTLTPESFLQFLSYDTTSPSLRYVTDIYEQDTQVGDAILPGRVELLGAQALRLHNTSTTATGLMRQIVAPVRSRDRAVDVHSRIFIKLISGGIQFLRKWVGGEASYSKWLVTDGFTPTIPSSALAAAQNRLGNWTQILNANENHFIVDHLVNNNDGYFDMRVHPGTELIIGFPQSFMPVETQSTDTLFTGLSSTYSVADDGLGALTLI